MSDSRIIVHCDLDAFYAAVETLHHGFDDTVPLIIGSDPENGRGRGIVSTCNYAARKFGIRSAMAISEAWRRCPGAPYGNGIYIRGSRGLYSRASRKVMKILQHPAQYFEQASIDEAYLDITEYVNNDWDSAVALCRRLQNEIIETLGLSASFGIAANRILAKMASEINKPRGIFRILPDELSEFFEGRDIREVPGIGKKRATQLYEWGITTVDEMYTYGELSLSRITGERFASWITRVYEGKTSSEISPLRSRKSIGKEHTFDYDRENYQVVLENLLSIVRRVMKSAREIGVSGRLAEVKIRYTGFETHTHGRSIPVSMNDDEVFTSLAERLFANNVQSGKKIRLIGFRLGHLDTPTTKQTRLMSLFEEE
ncbi:MAG: DNA polymerase IV [Candidatus Thermoplasmatota archaeon]|nr:DNA polymerase IV [Candidatus Thermoplasmatota archaeon]MEC7255767.1 DNA polymerase IV [Candidatus Thermoplasmatota archaeon]MEC8243017.1 DNA polymerase IV [Candidatus Thermoplasmatota archaeon]